MSSTNEQDIPQAEVAAPDGTETDNLAIIARQAIVDANRAVYGYELFDRSTASDSHTAASDAALLFNALSYAGTEALVGKKTVFINCTHESLAGGHLELIHPDKVVLEVPPLADSATAEEIEARVATLDALRTRGFRLAFDQHVLKRSYVSWLPLAGFIKLDMQAFKPELAGPLVKFAGMHSQATLIAEKVETPEQYQLMADLGVKLFQGYWFAKPSLVKATTIRPSQATIIQLINLVRKQASTAEIEDLLKKDPTLSFNLLRFINSSGFGLSCEVTSFRHAVMILGLKKLFRWAALLMTTSRAGGPPPAVGTTAVVRGRLMELLAAELLPPRGMRQRLCGGRFLTAGCNAGRAPGKSPGIGGLAPTRDGRTAARHRRFCAVSRTHTRLRKRRRGRICQGRRVLAPVQPPGQLGAPASPHLGGNAERRLIRSPCRPLPKGRHARRERPRSEGKKRSSFRLPAPQSQLALMPALRMMRALFSDSSAIWRANSAAVPPVGTLSVASSLLRISGSASALFSSALSRSSTAAGV